MTAALIRMTHGCAPAPANARFVAPALIQDKNARIAGVPRSRLTAT
jgi:hypothetical protein